MTELNQARGERNTDRDRGRTHTHTHTHTERERERGDTVYMHSSRRTVSSIPTRERTDHDVGQ